MCWLAIALDGVEAEGATPETFKDKARKELLSLEYLVGTIRNVRSPDCLLKSLLLLKSIIK